jgi:hypothetical protein
MTAITYTVTDESSIYRNGLKDVLGKPYEKKMIPCFRVYRSPSSVAGQSICMATFATLEEAEAHKAALEADTAGMSYEELMQQYADNEG